MLAHRERVDRKRPNLRVRHVESLHGDQVEIAVARFGVEGHHERSARVLRQREPAAGIKRWNAEPPDAATGETL